MSDLRSLADHARRALDDVRAAQATNDRADRGGMVKRVKVPWREFFSATEALIARASRA